MSRCFSFPPPGYVRNGIRDEALIESIKREEEKAQKERKKERKREKREKREKKDKTKKASENGDHESKKRSHKKRHRDEGTKEDQKIGDHQKGKGHEIEHLEKSSLTEEHGHLIRSQNSCDSTLNSDKRQKLSPPPDGRHNNNSESIIRIRLPVKRQKDPEVLTSKEQQPCSSRGRIGVTSFKMREPASMPDQESVDHACYTSANAAPEQWVELTCSIPTNVAPEHTFHPLLVLRSNQI